MVDFKKIIMILVITTLFAAFVGSLVFAIHKNPKYEDYCNNQFYAEPAKPYPVATKNVTCPDFVVPAQNLTACMNEHGNSQYKYDSSGCTIGYYCDTCNVLYQDALAKFNRDYFIFSAIFGLLAILVGIYFPNDNNEFRDTVTTGFMFGGLVTLFIGTIVYFTDLTRLLRPIVLVIELGIIIFVAYKKMGKKK
jgi:hypothetical protein